MTWLAVLGGGEVLSCGGEMGKDGIGTRVRNCFNIGIEGIAPWENDIACAFRKTR